MQLASIREFRGKLPLLAKRGDLVVLTNHGKPVGCFYPFKQGAALPLDLKRDFVAEIGQKISKALCSMSVSEKDILDDFKKFKKSRRR